MTTYPSFGLQFIDLSGNLLSLVVERNKNPKAISLVPDVVLFQSNRIPHGADSLRKIQAIDNSSFFLDLQSGPKIFQSERSRQLIVVPFSCLCISTKWLHIFLWLCLDNPNLGIFAGHTVGCINVVSFHKRPFVKVTEFHFPCANIV